MVQYQAYVDMVLLRSALAAVDTLNRAMNGESPNPRTANAAARAAFEVLERCDTGPASRSRKATGAA